MKKETPTETVKSNVSQDVTKHNAVAPNKMLEATTLERQSTTSKLTDPQSATLEIITPMETVKSNVLADVIQDKASDSNTTLPKPAILENSASLLSNSDQKLSQGPKAPSDLERISPTTGKPPDGKSEQEVAHVDDIKVTTDSAGILEQQLFWKKSIPKSDAVIVPDVCHQNLMKTTKPTQNEESSLVQPDLSKKLNARQKRMRLDFRAEKRERNRTQAPWKPQ